MKALLVMLCALVCLVQAQTTSAPKPPPGVPLDAKLFNGRWYKVFFEHVDWPQAKLNCERKGGQLVVVPDSATWDFVKNLTLKRVWLGASKDNLKNEWRWVDESLVTFTAWLDGAPDNQGGKQHYLAEMDSNLWSDRAKEWDEYPQWPMDGYICQWDDPNQIVVAHSVPILPPGIPSDAKIFNGQGFKQYFERISWHEAKKRCEELGGQLAVIPDAATWKFVKALTSKSVWLGASDEIKEGEWKWIDGTPMSFTAWVDGEPQSAKKNEDYLCGYKSQGWVDAYPSWNAEGYICQWKLSAAKNTPAVVPPVIEVDAWDDTSGLLKMKSQNRLKAFKVTPTTTININGLSANSGNITPGLRVVRFTLVTGDAEALSSLILEGKPLAK